MTFLLLFPFIFSQEAKILLNNYGFGETPQEVKFTIHCSGDIPISNIIIYIDGKEYDKLSITLNPKKGITTTLILESGEHLVEVRSQEGAYDFKKVSVSSVENKQYSPPQEQVISFTKTKIFKIALAFVVASMVVVWLLTRRLKLDFLH